MSVLDELTTYLGAQGLGTGGVDLFYGTLKESFPDEVLVVLIYGGLMDEPTMGDSGSFGKGTRLEHPRVQVLCRGSRDDTDGPYQKAIAARTAFMKLENTTLGTAKYLAVEPLQPPFRLRTDENFREIYVFNCQVTKTVS